MLLLSVVITPTFSLSLSISSSFATLTISACPASKRARRSCASSDLLCRSNSARSSASLVACMSENQKLKADAFSGARKRLPTSRMRFIRSCFSAHIVYQAVQALFAQVGGSSRGLVSGRCLVKARD